MLLLFFFSKERSSKRALPRNWTERESIESGFRFTEDLNAFVNGIVLPQKLNVQNVTPRCCRLPNRVAACSCSVVIFPLVAYIAISNIATRSIDAYFRCAVYFTNDPDVSVSATHTAQLQRTRIILIFTQCVYRFSEITFVRLSAVQIFPRADRCLGKSNQYNVASLSSEFVLQRGVAETVSLSSRILFRVE